MFKRLALAAAVCISGLALSAPAADNASDYAVTAHATRTGNVISVAITFSERQTQPLSSVLGDPSVPHGDTPAQVTTVHSSPKVTLNDGSDAELIMANANGSAADAAGNLKSGTKIQVISIKGQDKLLLIGEVLQDGATVWADAQTVSVKPADEKK